MKEKIIVGVLVVGIAVAGALVVLRRNDLEKTKGSAPISEYLIHLWKRN